MTDASREPAGEGYLVDRDVLRALLTHVDELVVTCTRDGTMTFVSPSIALMLGYEPTELEGESIFDFVHPDEHEEVLGDLARWTDRSGSPRGQVHHIRAASGAWVEVYYDSVIGEVVRPLGDLVLTARPAGEYDPQRRALLQRLLDEDRLVRLARLFLDATSDQFEDSLVAAVQELSSLEWVTRVSLWTFGRDGDGDVACLRAAWSAAYDAPTLDLPRAVPLGDRPIGRRLLAGEEVHVRSVAHLPDDWALDREELLAIGVRSMVAVPMVSEGRSIGFVYVEITIGEIALDVSQRTVLRSAAAILASAFRRHEAEEQLARRAQTDILTGLPNRWAFLDAVEAAQREVAGERSPGLAVALIDLDGFALVNGIYGHDGGDQLLVAVGHRLLRAAPDHLRLFRLHGDEFLALATGVASWEPVEAALDELMRVFDVPFELRGQPVRLSASAGLVHTSDPATSGIDLIGRAGLVARLVRESRVDRRIGVEEGDLQEEAVAHARRQGELRDAVDEGAVVPYFQGEWDLLTGELVGAEALARWSHPREGVLEAGDFVPMAEDDDLIEELGTAVLRRACREAAAWRRPLKLRVNVSARQLADDTLHRIVLDALRDSGLPPERLTLELTETALLTDPVHAFRLLDRLRGDGIGLAIDDFGIGYSSLLYLKRLPVTSLKIDQSFVRGLPADDDDRAIVQTVIRLSETLGISVTAEGVENDEQRRALLDLGCTRAQGFLLSLPEPAGEFGRRLEGASS